MGDVSGPFETLSNNFNGAILSLCLLELIAPRKTKYPPSHSEIEKSNQSVFFFFPF